MSDVLTAGAVARLFGVDVRTVSRWIAEGLPHSRVGRGAAVDPASAVAWVRERDHQAAEARLAAALAKVDPEAALGRKRAADAGLAEMKLQRARGEVIPTSDVEAALLAEADATREAMLGVARDAVQTGLIAPAQESALQDLIRGALVSLSMMAVVLPPKYAASKPED